MKTTAYILAVLVATFLLVGAISVVVFQVPGRSTGELILATLSVTPLIYGPLVLGSLTAYWNVRRSPESRRFLGRWLWSVLAIEALAVVGLVVFAVAAGAPVWIPVSFATVSAALTAAAVPLGRRLQQHDESRRPPEPPWRTVGRDEVRRKVAVISAVFVTTLLVAAVVVVAVFAAVGEAPDDRESAVVIAILVAEFAFLAAAVTCLLVSLPLNRRLRASAGGDLGTLRVYSQAVLRGKSDGLDDEQRVGAAKYAVLIVPILLFQIGYLGLLYAALILQQILSLSSDPDGPGGFILVSLVVVLVALLPYQLVRARRARAYVARHALLLGGAEDAVSDPV